MRQDDGKIKYVIQDTWDSTKRNVYEYFVYKDKKEIPQSKNEIKFIKFEIGEEINHPQYGIGKIADIKNNISDRIFFVEFKSCGMKRISEKWILSNVCKNG